MALVRTSAKNAHPGPALLKTVLSAVGRTTRIEESLRSVDPTQLRVAMTIDDALREDLLALRASHERQAAWLSQLVGSAGA